MDVTFLAGSSLCHPSGKACGCHWQAPARPSRALVKRSFKSRAEGDAGVTITLQLHEL